MKYVKIEGDNQESPVPTIKKDGKVTKANLNARTPRKGSCTKIYL